MQKVVHLRILLDHETDVFRDIEIGLDQSFLELHDMIQEAFSFDNSQMASFYVSNEDWEKGQEISLMDLGERSENGETILMMHGTNVEDIVFDSKQKLVYVFDFMLMWCFFIDVIAIKEVDQNIILPRILNAYGDAPEQYSKSPELSFEIEEQYLEPDMDDSESDVEDMFKVLSSDHSVSEGDY